MTVSNVNGVNQVKSNPVKKAAIADGVVGGLDLAGSVALEKAAFKNFLNMAASNKDEYLKTLSMDVKDFMKNSKENLENLPISKPLIKYYDVSNPKYVAKMQDAINELKKSLETGTIDTAKILKRNLKGSAIVAGVVGAIALGVSLISSAVKANKGQKPE